MAEHDTACLKAWGGATPGNALGRQKKRAPPGAPRSPGQPQDRRGTKNGTAKDAVPAQDQDGGTPPSGRMGGAATAALEEEGVPNHAYLLCQHRHARRPRPDTSRRSEPPGWSARMSRMSRWPGQPTRRGNSAAPLPILERITIPLIRKAADDLRITHDRTGLSIIDIVNRAISLYEFVDAELSAKAELIVRHDGKDHLIKLL